MTGLSEELMANFQLMKALGDYTRQDPKKRYETLKKFSERINTNQETDGADRLEPVALHLWFMLSTTYITANRVSHCDCSLLI